MSWAITLVLAVAAALTVAVSTPAPASAAVLHPDFGLAAGCCTPVGTTFESQAAGYAATGAGWARMGFTWSTMEPIKGQYLWTRDSAVTAYRAQGLRILGVIAYSPAWATSATCFALYNNKCAPTNASDFASFAAAVAERYDGDGVSDAPGSPRVDAWEIWNEPNLANFWRPTPNPSAYTTLLRAAAPSIRAAAPGTTIVSAGLSPAGGTFAPITFLQGMYAAGARGSFDALGFHPYSYPALATKVANWNAWQQMFRAFPANGQPNSLRSVMITNGDGNKQIWATEYGAPTYGDTTGDLVSNCDDNGVNQPNEDNCVTEARQAQMVADALAQWQSYSWSGPLFWYSYQDLLTGGPSIESNFGLVRSDGTGKPGLDAFRAATGA